MTLLQQLVQQYRELAADASEHLAGQGVIVAVHGDRVDVRLGTGGVRRDLPVSGGVVGARYGDEVYLLNFEDGGAVVLNTRTSADGQPLVAGGAHSHAGLYGKSEINAALARKADREHKHIAPTAIIAQTGRIGGWSIDAFGITALGARLTGGGPGSIAFGPLTEVPTVYGDYVGAFLGFDLAGSQAQMSLYKDANNFLKWDGSKLLIQSEHFSLDATGHVRADGGGTVAGWEISDTALTAPDGLLVLDSTGSLRGGGFVSGLVGWEVQSGGHAEFGDVNVRGALHTVTLVSGEQHALGGTFLVAGAAVLNSAVTSL